MGDTTTVVALGPVPGDIVGDELGAGVEFVADPGPGDLKRAEGAIVRAAVTVGEAEMAKMPNLRVIARTGVGVDDVELDAATRRDITVAITPGANTNAVAEGAFAHMLHLVKSLSPLTRVVREGKWEERTTIPVGDLEGATLGIVGYGRIGRRVHRIADAFGMSVIAYDPVADVPGEHDAGTVDNLLGQADVVTLHVPLLDSTRDLIDQTSLNTMKDGVILVNTSRGGLIDEDAALAALEAGKLAGVGLDAFAYEPARSHPLYQHPRTVLTPHVMGLSAKSARTTFIDAAKAVHAVLHGRPPAATAN